MMKTMVQKITEVSWEIVMKKLCLGILISSIGAWGSMNATLVEVQIYHMAR